MMFVGFENHDMAGRALEAARDRLKDAVIEFAKRNLNNVP